MIYIGIAIMSYNVWEYIRFAQRMRSEDYWKTEQQIFNHLTGREVIVIYPYLPNGTCRFLVFDFDNHVEGAERNDFANETADWQFEVNALRRICIDNGLDPLVERSRSGRGAHLWIFFEKAIPVKIARNFGNESTSI